MPYVEPLGRHAPDYRFVVREADRILDENVVLEPPVQLKELVENAGLQLVYADFPHHLSNVMGFFDPGENQIVVNRTDAPNRQRFTVAHEFGHAVCIENLS